MPAFATLDEFLNKLVGDLGAATTAALVGIGDKLGLYKALAGSGGLTPKAARRTHAHRRALRAGVALRAGGRRLRPVRRVRRHVLARREPDARVRRRHEPGILPRRLQVARSMFKDMDKIVDAFRTGQGVGWHEHDAELFCGTERFFRTGYNANLTSAWLPTLDGVVAKLESGATVADVGCGHGASTITMARAYPRSRFVGYDYHGPSVESARARAAETGLADRITFERASAKDFAGGPYDLVCIFDALHDMGDPVGVAKHVRGRLKPDGTWMLVEPFAHDRLEDNLNPVGRIFYAASTMICTPASRSQEVGLALGAQAGPKRLEGVCRDAGFTRFRKATRRRSTSCSTSGPDPHGRGGHAAGIGGFRVPLKRAVVSFDAVGSFASAVTQKPVRAPISSRTVNAPYGASASE
jgi:2-polyprenyl-3-methyl-5-hydroxy-6-metoxy-1,4-benzoquinol methylase